MKIFSLRFLIQFSKRFRVFKELASGRDSAFTKNILAINFTDFMYVNDNWRQGLGAQTMERIVL